MAEMYAYATVTPGARHILVETGKAFTYRPGGDGPEVDDVEPGLDRLVELPGDVAGEVGAFLSAGGYCLGTDESERTLERIEQMLDAALETAGFWRSRPWMPFGEGIRADLETDE